MNSPYWASGASPGLAALGLQGVLLEEISFLFSSLKIAIQGPGAVPEYLFSPERQERFGARGSPK